MEFKEILSEKMQTLNERSRPRLKGRALKKRKAKSEVMKKLKKSSTFKSAKERLMKIAKKEAKKIAKDNDIRPNLVDLDKITVREDSITMDGDMVNEGSDELITKLHSLLSIINKNKEFKNMEGMDKFEKTMRKFMTKNYRLDYTK